jgi:putative ABC transport system substrate-binding protein
VITRRNVAFAGGIGLLIAPRLQAQQAGQALRIVLLLPDTEPTPVREGSMKALNTGLRDLGWVEGKNLVIETRWAGLNPQRQREMAAGR